MCKSHNTARRCVLIITCHVTAVKWKWQVTYLRSHVNVCAVTSVMSDSVIQWTVARQTPLSRDSPGKNTGMGSHFLLQGRFSTQGLNSSLQHCRRIPFFFFLLYNIVLVLPYINVNPPWVYTCSPSWTPPSHLLPHTSLWVISVHQPQAFHILHRTWTGD